MRAHLFVLTPEVGAVGSEGEKLVRAKKRGEMTLIYTVDLEADLAEKLISLDKQALRLSPAAPNLALL